MGVKTENSIWEKPECRTERITAAGEEADGHHKNRNACQIAGRT